MKSKVKFFKSKINWLGIVMCLGAAYDFVASYTANAWDYRTIAMFGFGLAIVVLRTWFTQTTIQGDNLGL